MNSPENVYDLLVDELEDRITWMDKDQAREIVQYLEDQGFLDYDNLKEIHLYGEV